jgi:hypothetical protein
MQFNIDGTQVLHIQVDTHNLETKVSYSSDFQGASIEQKPDQGDPVGVHLALDHYGRVSVKISGNALYDLLTKAGFLTEGSEPEVSHDIRYAGVR